MYGISTINLIKTISFQFYVDAKQRRLIINQNIFLFPLLSKQRKRPWNNTVRHLKTTDLKERKLATQKRIAAATVHNSKKKERVTDLELGRCKCRCRKLIIIRDPKQASTDLNWMNNRERKAADPFQGNNYRFVLWTAKKVCFFPK